MHFKVAVTTSQEYPVSMRVVEEVFGERAEVREVEVPFRALEADETATYASRLAGCEGMLVRSGIFGRELMERLDVLRVIAVHGAGFDQIDIEAAEELGIAVANAPGANATAVIELALALMLTIQRRLFDSASKLKNERDWSGAKNTGRELAGKQLGLVGIGRIGYGVATRAHALGMSVIAYDPYLSQEFHDPAVRIARSVDEIFTESDVISLHVPLNDATRHMIDRRALSLMRNDCVIVNTSRGALIDEHALCEALGARKIAGAALDVFEMEPMEEDNPLFSLDNVILTPHVGGSTVEALDSVARMASEEIFSFLASGAALKHPVNNPRNPRR